MTEATMAWVDMETTGLDALLDVPLELGIILTDDHLNEVARAKWLIHEMSKDYTQGVRRGVNNKFVQPMHEKSGLWDALACEPVWSREEVDAAACALLERLEVKFGTLPMCGNSIGSLDRPFAIRHFPHFNEALSYRQIDISTFKEVCKRVNKDLWEDLRDVAENKENATHRVFEDCEASIAEYRAYLDNLIITGDEY